MDVKVIIAIGQIVQAIVDIGVPAVKAVVAQFEKDGEPTMEEILALGDSMVKPENFFDKDVDASSD